MFDIDYVGKSKQIRNARSPPSLRPRLASAFAARLRHRSDRNACSFFPTLTFRHCHEEFGQALATFRDLLVCRTVRVQHTSPLPAFQNRIFSAASKSKPPAMTSKSARINTIFLIHQFFLSGILYLVASLERRKDTRQKAGKIRAKRVDHGGTNTQNADARNG